MRISVLAVALALVCAPALAEEPMTAETPKLTFERVFASPSLDGSSPRQAKLSPDGRWLTLLRNRETDRERYDRSEEHTSELQSLMRISYAVFCLKKKNKYQTPKRA